MRFLREIKVLASILLIFIVFLNVSTAEATLNFSGVDYVQPENASISFGGNVWHDNFTKGTAIFPLVEQWTTNVGSAAEAQPIIIDDIVYILGDKKIQALKKETGERLGQIQIQSTHNISSSNLFAVKNSETEYQLIIPSNDGFVRSIKAIANKVDIDGSRKETRSVSMSIDWSWNINNISNEKVKHSKLVTNDVTILKDRNLEKTYIGFGTHSGNLVVLDLKSGQPIGNSNVEIEGSLGSGSGLVYNNFATVITPINSSKGGFINGTVMNGVLQITEIGCPNFEKFDGFIGPTAYAVIENPIYNSTTGMMLTQNKAGSILAYDTSNKKTLFIIDKYKGYTSINGFSIAGNHILATVSNETSSKVMVINYKDAIIEGQNANNRRANNSIVFEEDFSASNYNSALALSAAEQKTDDFGNIQETVYREVFLVGNRGKNKNLNMFYLDQYNASSKKAILVKYGFRIMQQEGIYTTTDSLDISGGVFTPLTYAGGYLIFGDSKGNIHAYSALKEENLALMNMENSEEKLSRGETYVAAVDVVNYTGESQNNIPMEFYINGDLVYYAKIDIPEDGITVKFQYTLPNNYDLDKVFIEAKLNMREPRDFEETTYEDNVLSMDLEVYRPIDLIAKNLRNNTPVPANSGQIAQVDIQNASDMNLEDILVYYRVNGKNIKSERISLSGNSTVTRSFAWTAPSFTTTAVLSVVVDPEREVNDINRNNNTAIYNVQVNATPTIIPNSCNNGVARGGFNVEYIWQIGSTPPPDSKPIYAHETVNYEETMTMKVTVNTNQQNQNSRGGWEIVPYSKREGISANKVTRSGYGIELKVDIDYSELGRWSATRGRWEIRPYVYFNGMRKDAPLKGANYLNRLKNVKVYANLPNGQRVEMVRTKDGTNAVTYELPEITYTPAGLNETWSGRFFSMPPRTPDGKYPFTIEVVGGGQSNLSCTVEEEIYIYGDVFRDTNVQISR